MVEPKQEVGQIKKKNSRPLIRSAACTLVLYATFFFSHDLTYAQGVYKWIDASGKVHYGDRQVAPQRGAKVAEVLVKNEIRSKKNDEMPDSDKKQPEEKGVNEVPSFRGISADRMKKCTSVANEVALIQAEAFDVKRQSYMWEQVEKIRTYCPATGFECAEERTAQNGYRCTPFFWTGTNEIMRGSFNGITFKLKPRKY